MDGKKEMSEVRQIIIELQRWKHNRDRKSKVRIMNQKIGLSSDALDRAIYYLERYEKLLQWIIFKKKQ